MPGAGERWLDSFRLQRGQRREDERRGRAVVRRWARQRQRGGLGWHVALDAPLNDFTIGAPSMAFGGRDARQPKPGMIGEHRDEPLAHQPGGAQHDRWDTARWWHRNGLSCVIEDFCRERVC